MAADATGNNTDKNTEKNANKDANQGAEQHDDIIEATVVEKSSEASQESVSDTTTEQTNESVADPIPTTTFTQETQSHGHKGVWVVSILNFLLIIILAATAYWYWQQQQNTTIQANPKVTALESSMTKVNKQLETLTVALNSNKTLTNDQQTLLLELVETSSKQVITLDDIAQRLQLNELKNVGLAQRIADVSGRRPSDWLLAEADYLVKLAGKKLWLENDVKSAIMLLKSADVRISDLADASLLPVRALLAKDIQTLQQVNQVATESIALSISALIAQVDTLPLDTLKLPDAEVPAQQATVSNDVRNWQENLKASWDAIVSDFVTVEKRTAAITPFMSAKQQWLAREQLKFALLNAQQAVMQGQSTLYKQALQQSLDILVAHYQLDNVSVEAYISTIQELVMLDTSRELPAQLDAQQPLGEIIEQRIQTLFAGGR
ncbi:MAG: uroporphyrinogen-III C-methyltransferase [Glaciecola sp.]|nr:uroporphyrinogen-III C-methyltransferase [Glaciecola sp.]